MIFKIWFSLISTMLFVYLVLLLINFQLSNIFHWAYLLVLTCAIMLTTLAYLEKIHNKDVKTLERDYAEFLKQKDKQIEELQKKSGLLFKTAVKRTEKDLELEELKRKLEEKTIPS